MTTKKTEEIRPLVYPWTAGDLDAPKILKAEIMQEMRSLYPGVVGMGKPEGKVIKVLYSVVSELMTLKEEGKVPWIVCLSWSAVLLQTLAKLIPATVMLTLKLKCLNITTDTLVDLFKMPTPHTDFEDDPAGEALHRIKNRGLVVWENFFDLKASGNRFSTQFSSLMGYRLDNKKMTVFLSRIKASFSPASLKELRGYAEKSMGSTVPAMLQEAAVWKQIQVSPSDVSVRKEAF